MYNIYRDGVIMGLVDTRPTDEQLKELGCDSYDEYIEPVETYDAKKIRVMASLISSSDISSVDIEGIVFSNKEIGDIILDRVFGGNPHAESALQAKISSYIISVISGEPNTEILTEIEEKQKRVNEVRNKFGLASLVA